MAPPTDALGSANVVRCTPHHQYMRWRGEMIAPPHGRTEANQCRDVLPRSFMHADPPPPRTAPRSRHTPTPSRSGIPASCQKHIVAPVNLAAGFRESSRRGAWRWGDERRRGRRNSRECGLLVRPTNHRHRHHKTHPRNHNQRWRLQKIRSAAKWGPRCLQTRLQTDYSLAWSLSLRKDKPESGAGSPPH